jgi:tetratricopeptide (TPR) repeat protein
MKRSTLPLLAILLLILPGPRLSAADADAAYTAATNGIQLYREGKYDEAIQQFDEAIRLNPEDASSYRNRAVAYNKKGDHAQAVASYTEALKIAPDDVPAHAGRGAALLATGNFKDAVEDFDAVLKAKPAVRLFEDRPVRESGRGLCRGAQDQAGRPGLAR